jgi:hypothetical protein
MATTRPEAVLAQLRRLFDARAAGDASVTGIGTVEYIGSPKARRSVTGLGAVRRRRRRPGRPLSQVLSVRRGDDRLGDLNLRRRRGQEQRRRGHFVGLEHPRFTT